MIDLNSIINSNYFFREAIGWIVILLMGVRWFLQMNASKIEGKSVIPLSFWIVSLIAGTLGMWYSIMLESTSLIFAHIFGFGLVGYNLFIIIKNKENLYARRSL